MLLTQLSYYQLPPAVCGEVEAAIGPVLSAEPATGGQNSSVAAVLKTAKRRYFVKALPVEHRWVWTQLREAEMAPHVAGLGAPLITRFVADGWDVLIFDALHGRQANFAPISPDLPRVVQLLARVGEMPLPHIRLRRAEQRLSEHVPPDQLHHFVGNTLLHTDLNPANIIVGSDGTRLVDWAWATEGAGWLNPAYWVVWLIAAGHSPRSAEWWAAQVPAWRTASVEGVTLFAQALAAMWSDVGGPHPDSWTRPLVEASARWRSYRGVPEPVHGRHSA